MVYSQIYSPCTPEEALRCIDLGADCIGEVVSAGSESNNKGDTFPVETVRKIFDAINAKAERVLIVYGSTPEEALSLAVDLDADVLQTIFDDLEADRKTYELRNAMIPELRISRSVLVRDRSSIDIALEAEKYCDALILDTPDPRGIGGGTTGAVHDWNISREIVERTSVPVIMAGGLGPDNVGKCIDEVRPFCVDSFTKVSTFGPDGLLTGKDFDLVGEFCRIAHSK
ncbi:MAG: phosphoribosylanthranilate isomerase [Oscillospiraceae bacterium]|jgi:phosphoribosylanthranilate isomerase